MNTDSLRYAGFWTRLEALVLDALIILPLGALVFWLEGHYRLFRVYYLMPGILFSLFYNVYLVQRFGGTPGKLIVGIRIRKLDGEQIGYLEAFIRYLPFAIFGLLMSINMVLPLLQSNNSELQPLDFPERVERIVESPSWYKPFERIENAWTWCEIIALLMNRKRRTLHDFIAGTVVVHEPAE